jgi:hypothetical protein
MRNLWQNYSLSIVLFVLFIASWVIQSVTGWFEFVAEQGTHDERARIFGPDGYIWPWAEATFENWQSEFLQLFAFVVLTTFLVHKGSAESKDSDERMQAALDRIEKRLDELSPGSSANGPERTRTESPASGAVHR